MNCLLGREKSPMAATDTTNTFKPVEFECSKEYTEIEWSDYLPITLQRHSIYFVCSTNYGYLVIYRYNPDPENEVDDLTRSPFMLATIDKFSAVTTEQELIDGNCSDHLNGSDGTVLTTTEQKIKLTTSHTFTVTYHLFKVDENNTKISLQNQSVSYYEINEFGIIRKVK